MARSSKPPGKKDNSEATDAVESIETVGEDSPETGESSADAPLVLEAEAVEVGENAEQPEIMQTNAAEDQASDVADPDLVEDITQTMPEPAPPPPPPEPNRGSVFPMLLGGLAAGGIGYLAATFGVQPPPPAVEPPDISGLSESISSNGASIEALADQIAELQNAPPAVAEGGTVMPDLTRIDTDIAQLAERIGAFEVDMQTIEEQIMSAVSTFEENSMALDQRIAALEANPGANASEEDLAAFRDQLSRMSAEAEARMLEAETRAAEVQAAAEAAAAEAEAKAAEAETKAAEAVASAARQTALIELQSAIENGAVYTDILPRIGDAPDVIVQSAEKGVPSLGSLQQTFPDAARKALGTVEAVPQDASAGERLTAFLRRQTNARSLTPRDGNDVDAILSRAEARLGEGDLASTLSELSGLPDSARQAFDGWITRAETRAAAIDAVRELTATN